MIKAKLIRNKTEVLRVEQVVSSSDIKTVLAAELTDKLPSMPVIHVQNPNVWGGKMK